MTHKLKLIYTMRKHINSNLLQHTISSSSHLLYFPPLFSASKTVYMDYFSLPIGPYKHQPATHFLTQTPQTTHLDIDLPLIERCPRPPTPTSTPTSTPTTPPPLFPLTLPSRRPPAPTSQAAAAPGAGTQTPTTTTCVSVPGTAQTRSRRSESKSFRSAMRGRCKRWLGNVPKIWKR